MTTHSPLPLMVHLRDGVQVVASVFVVLGGIYAGSVWLTGGFKPQTQIAADELRKQVSDVQQTITAVKDRLDAMPRPSDYVDQQAHLARIDGALGAIGDRFTRDEIAAAETSTKVQRLIDGSSAPLRLPR